MFEKEAEEKITQQFGTSGEYITRQRIWQDGAEFGYNKANEWHYVKDKLPPEPEEKDGLIKPLYYICAYQVMADYETDFFMYVGNGEFLGNSEYFPIYAWLDCPVNVPQPPKEK